MSIERANAVKMITAIRLMSLATDTLDEITGKEFDAWFKQQCVDGLGILLGFVNKVETAMLRYAHTVEPAKPATVATSKRKNVRCR